MLKCNGKGLKTIQSSTKSLGSARRQSNKKNAKDEASDSSETKLNLNNEEPKIKTTYRKTEKDEQFKGLYSSKASHMAKSS